MGQKGSVRKALETQEALKLVLLDSGRLQLACVESTVCGLAAPRKITYKKADAYFKQITCLRSGKGSVNEGSSPIEVASWAKAIEKISLAITHEHQIILYKDSKKIHKTGSK